MYDSDRICRPTFVHRFVVRHSIEEKLYCRAEALGKSTNIETTAIASPSKRQFRSRKPPATASASDEGDYSALSVGELLQIFEQTPDELDDHNALNKSSI